MDQNKPTVFISYSHKDELWKDRLRPHLKVLEHVGHIDIWDDRNIDVGSQWYDEIKQVMEGAAVAVCLISADYLSSDFCVKEEIPYLLERYERDGMILIPILVRPCVWKAVPWLKKTQMLPRDGKNLAGDFNDNGDEIFAQVAELIFEIFDNPNYQPPAPPPPSWPSPDKIDIGRLPTTGAELFGRQKELELLDQAWESSNAHIVSLVAWGGVGKSTLVNKWLEQMKVDNYRGARRVYAWSFYSQGTSERVTSADQFINHALTWFGDADPTTGSPWDKGERLAKLIQSENTLLLLDGLEPLQSPHAHERGVIKDPALATLLAGLARRNQGLCIITTREELTDLKEFPETVIKKDLEQISEEAGRALLRVGGVQGTDDELENATHNFGNQALAIKLLAVYLRDISGHHVSHAAEIPDLDIPEEDGKHPRRVMTALAQRFGPSAEVELLKMLGLFDRPADKASLRALRRAPAIHGLTDHIRKLTNAGWLRLVEKLRRYQLVASQSQHRPDDLDAHPLVRQHFGQELKQKHSAAWRAGNYRLYDHLKRTAKVFPNTLEEMAPLYAAVTHGCEASKHQEVLDKIYYERIQRGTDFFSKSNLGAFSSDLAALTNFFNPMWQQPVAGLTESFKGFLLNDTGWTLLSLGRSLEAAPLVQTAVLIAISRGDWRNAVAGAINLSRIYLTIGNLHESLNYSNQAMTLARDTPRKKASLFCMADVLFQTGRLEEAELAFRKAEEIKEESSQRDEPLFIYSTSDFLYCDMLLDQGKYSEVQMHAAKTLKWVTAQNWLLEIALSNLYLGRACLFQAQLEGEGDFTLAMTYLKQAVNGLRQAGQLYNLPKGLLARAELYRIKSEFNQARADLDEAMNIAMRGSMGLYEADCHLEYARLYLVQGEKEKARERWTKAKVMIERMGYHRRDKDVREIGEDLGEVAD